MWGTVGEEVWKMTLEFLRLVARILFCFIKGLTWVTDRWVERTVKSVTLLKKLSVRACATVSVKPRQRLRLETWVITRSIWVEITVEKSIEKCGRWYGNFKVTRVLGRMSRGVMSWKVLNSVQDDLSVFQAGATDSVMLRQFLTRVLWRECFKKDLSFLFAPFAHSLFCLVFQHFAFAVATF